MVFFSSMSSGTKRILLLDDIGYPNFGRHRPTMFLLPLKLFVAALFFSDGEISGEDRLYRDGRVSK